MIKKYKYELTFPVKYREYLEKKLKELVLNRKDVDSENRINRVKGLSGDKILQKTIFKFTGEVKLKNALKVIEDKEDDYLKYVENFQLELLLSSKNKPGNKKLKKYYKGEYNPDVEKIIDKYK